MSQKKISKRQRELFQHEALDRLFIGMNNIDNNLTEHPAIRDNKKASKKLSKAIGLLYECYVEVSKV